LLVNMPKSNKQDLIFFPYFSSMGSFKYLI